MSIFNVYFLAERGSHNSQVLKRKKRQNSPLQRVGQRLTSNLHFVIITTDWFSQTL